MNLQRTIFQTFILVLIATFYSCQEMEMEPESNPTESSEMSSPTLKSIKIGQDKFQYEEFPDGLKVMEGDIVISSEFINKLENLAAKPGAKIEDLLDVDEKGRPAFATSSGRVSGTGDPFDSPYTGGTVYYYINSDVPEQYEITDAIADWDSKTSLTFVQLTSPGSSTSSNWIEFIKRSSGCASTIPGFQTGNRVYVSQSCSTANIKHEIGHALGLFHEHQRVDRDSEIEVLWDYIPENKRNNYRLTNTLIYSYTLGNGNPSFSEGNVDFNSIMIYNSYEPEIGTNVMVKKNDIPSNWTKPNTISSTDVATINRIFNDDTEDKFIFSPFDFVIEKSGCTYNLSWDHNGGISGLAGVPDKFWLFKNTGGINGEWEYYATINGGGTRSYSFSDCSAGYTPRWRISAVKSSTGAYSPSTEGVYDFPGNCSCTDDFEFEHVVYIEPSSSGGDYLYEVGWKELPSGYPTIQLGYTTNSGVQVTLRDDDFLTCETGWEWFAAPNYTASNGPQKFWIKAIDSNGYVRYCNGNLWSSYYINRQQ